MSIRNILTLVFNHQYYRNSRCSNFLVQADALTEKFLKKNRMLVRYIQNSWKLFTDIEDDSLWVPIDFETGKIHLKFTLSSSDENFYKSVYDPNFMTGINCVCNKKGCVELQACSCTNSSCSNFSRNILPVCIMRWAIVLDFDITAFLNSDNIYTLNFKVKDVYWKYYVFNSNEQETLSITDADSEVSFIQERKEVFPYNKTAFTFISDKKIPLSESDSHTFRLVIKKGGNERYLIKRLPVATASGIQFKDSSKKDFMSLIFINT